MNGAMAPETTATATTEINDKREAKEFRSISFSGFKKTDVKQAWLQSVMQGKIESACYWTAELVCAGHYADIWDLVLFFYGKHVHTGNPKLAHYLDFRIQAFRSIVQNGFRDMELRLRNLASIRKLFCEVVCFLCLVKRKHQLEEIKVSATTDFAMPHMADKLRAPHVHYAADAFLEGDPQELLVAVNELAFHVSADSLHGVEACFWIEWLMHYEALCKNRREVCRIERRPWAPVPTAYQKDIVWIVWGVLQKEVTERFPAPSPVSTLFGCLLRLFSLKYNGPAVYKRRRYLVYLATLLLVEAATLPWDTPMLTTEEKEFVRPMVERVDSLYREIKKNEVSPNTDYLFKNVQANHLEKSLEKLEAMNRMEEGGWVPTATATATASEEANNDANQQRYEETLNKNFVIV
jgi:hypothetical protein